MCKEEQIAENLRQIRSVLQNYLEKDSIFTGKIVFTVNCRNGGVGSVEAHVQKKIDRI